MLRKEDGLVDFAAQTARETYNRWRGFSPWPGVHTRFRGKRFLLSKVRVAAEGAVGASQLPPGGLRLVDGELLVGMADGTVLALDEVQLEGKARMGGAEFARGYQVKAGERLG